jgi:hypothetical protein
LRLVEPIDPSSEDSETGESSDRGVTVLREDLKRPLQRLNPPGPFPGICANPLRDEPSPTAIATVKRFGVVGLIACALGSGVARWWRSRQH